MRPTYRRIPDGRSIEEKYGGVHREKDPDLLRYVVRVTLHALELFPDEADEREVDRLPAFPKKEGKPK
jgi:hypothetical protein